MPQQWAQTGEVVHAMAGTLGNAQPGEMEKKTSERGSFLCQNVLQCVPCVPADWFCENSNFLSFF